MKGRTTVRRLALVSIGTVLLFAQAGLGQSQPPQGGAIPLDPAAVERGAALYGVTYNCASCHGANGRGGPGGIAALTESPIAMSADTTSLLRYLRAGRPDRGMPAFPALSEGDAASLSARIRSFVAPIAEPLPAGGGRGRGGRGGPAAGVVPDGVDPVLVGDAAAGRAYFNGPVGQCSSCHAVEAGQSSSAANLSAIGAKYRDARTLQNNMLLNRGLSWSPESGTDVAATITYRDGRTVTGILSSISDFKVIIRNEEGVETTITRSRGEPRVVLTDRLQHHLDLLDVYNDDDIHNLTAYLATLQ